MLELNHNAMSADTKSIYEEYIKPLSREDQHVLLKIMQAELSNGDDSGQRRNILDLHGLGREIWQGVDPKEYVRKLRDDLI